MDPETTFLWEPRALPEDGLRERIVIWRVFRSREEAHAYSGHILLGEGQHIVGGTTEDDVGPVFWVGVQVDDVARWGNSRAIQMSDSFDGQNPGTSGRPFD